MNLSNGEWHSTLSPRTEHVATLLEDGKTILVYGDWNPNIDENTEDSNGKELIFSDSFHARNGNMDLETWTKT